MKMVYFIHENGTVTASEWGLLGGLKAFAMLQSVNDLKGTVVYGGRGEVSLQTLPAVSGRPGWEMVQRKMNEFAGKNPLAVMTVIERKKFEKTIIWRFAQMFCDIRNADLHWWMMTIENMAIDRKWGNKILLLEMYGKKHLAVFDKVPYLIGYHDCSGDFEDDISRVIQSWRGKRMGLEGIVSLGCDWRGAETVAWSDLGTAFSLDPTVVSAHPEILLCHPKILRPNGDWQTDAMRKEAKQKMIAGFFYGCALVVMVSSFWLAGSLYSDGLKAQEQTLGFERERQAIAAKLDFHQFDQGADAAFLKTAIKAADDVNVTAPMLIDAFQVIRSAVVDEKIKLEKMSIKPTAEHGVSEMRVDGTVTPIVSNGRGKIYSSTLKFLKGFCDSLSVRNAGLVKEAKIESLGLIVSTNKSANVTEPASSTEKMPFQILIRMRRG